MSFAISSRRRLPRLRLRAIDENGINNKTISCAVPGSGSLSGARSHRACPVFHVPRFTRRIKQSVFYQELQYRSAGPIDTSGCNILFDLRCFEAASDTGE